LIGGGAGYLASSAHSIPTGGQLFFAFLFSIAFAPGFSSLSDTQRVLYGWNLFDSPPWLAYASAALLAISWIVIPLALREPRNRTQETDSPPE
jgi:hypothetical protein